MSVMRVQMTEVYRDWINSLKDRAGRARVQVVSIGWCTEILVSIEC
jgi:putative component of toxin-antitoxin plasmid stabilization module